VKTLELRQLPLDELELKRHFILNEIKAIASLLVETYSLEDSNKNGFAKVGMDLIFRDAIGPNGVVIQIGWTKSDYTMQYESYNSIELVSILDRFRTYSYNAAEEIYRRNKKREEEYEIHRLRGRLIQEHSGNSNLSWEQTIGLLKAITSDA